VVSGYLITYGGFLLLGVGPGTCWAGGGCLIAGTALFRGSSLACGLPTPGAAGRRPARPGLGAAMMSPAALSILTTPFQDSDRTRRWACGPGSAGWLPRPGVFFGGLLTQDSAGGGCSS